MSEEILIVDDNSDIRNIINELITDSGYILSCFLPVIGVVVHECSAIAQQLQPIYDRNSLLFMFYLFQ